MSSITQRVGRRPYCFLSSVMITFRKLMIAWVITLSMSLLLPILSVAAVSSTMHEVPFTTTTISSTTAEHTTTIDAAQQSISCNHAQVLSGLSRLLLVPKTTIPSTGGVIRQFEQQGVKTYYRVYSGSDTTGKWLTSVPPKSSAWAQEALALPRGNTANFIQEVVVPNGTMLERSRAIPMPAWGRMRGGAENNSNCLKEYQM